MVNSGAWRRRRLVSPLDRWCGRRNRAVVIHGDEEAVREPGRHPLFADMNVDPVVIFPKSVHQEALKIGGPPHGVEHAPAE